MKFPQVWNFCVFVDMYPVYMIVLDTRIVRTRRGGIRIPQKRDRKILMYGTEILTYPGMGDRTRSFFKKIKF